MDNINRENYSEILKEFNQIHNLKINNISKTFDCSKATIERLLNRDTFPTEEMLKQTGLLIIVGPEDYAKLNKTQKEKVSDSLGALSGAGLGFASISAVVGGLGITGLSGAGIMSGLATLGGIVGAGAVGGIIFVAGVPVVAGVAGYGLIKY